MGELTAGFVIGCMVTTVFFVSGLNKSFVVDKNTAVKCGIAVYSTTDKAITLKDEWKELLK